MSEWREFSIGSLIGYKKGYAFKSELFGNDGDLVVRVSDTTNDSIDITSCPRIKLKIAKEYNNYRICKGDIIISTVGSWPENPNSIVGKVIKVPSVADNALLNQNTVRLRALNSTHQLFLYYRLKNNDFSTYLISGAQGSANQASITLDDIFNFRILLPEDDEIQSITNILSSLDDKIDVLHRQNKTLEQLAETLFRQWFVEEVHSKEELMLGDYVKCINGYSYKSTELNPSNVALVTLKSFNRNGGFSLDGFKEFTGKINEHQIVKEGDLVVAHTDITQEAEVIGNPALIIGDPRYKTLIMTMDLVKVVPKDSGFSIPFLYHLMRTPAFKFHCLGCANGTTVLHLSKSSIPTFTFSKPDFNKVRLFTLEAEKLTKKFLMNHSQICTLTQLRDKLLPKLICGEVRVKYE